MTSRYEHIAYEVADGVAVVTLDRPDHLNAFTGRMLTELLDVLDRTDADDGVRVVVFTGAGRAFCAGADLSGGGATFDPSARVAAFGHEGNDVPRDGGGMLTLRLFESRKPLIAAVNGPAVGVGLTMTLPMDIRVAADDAKLGFVFTRRGVLLDAAASWFLPRVVGISRATEWVTTGRIFSASEALDAGLFSSLHPKGDVLEAACAVAREIVANTAPVSVAVCRQLLWQMLTADHPMEAHRIESLGFSTMGGSPDAHEGVTAFLEKRSPRFTMQVSRDTPRWFPWWPARRYRPEGGR